MISSGGRRAYRAFIININLDAREGRNTYVNGKRDLVITCVNMIVERKAKEKLIIRYVEFVELWSRA